MAPKTQNTLKILWAIIFAVGTVAVIWKFATGERLVGYGSYVPWGLWIALYFHFIGIAGGIFVVGTFGYFLNYPLFRRHLRKIMAIALASLFAGLLSVWLDLGHPFRFQKVFLSPNFGSMMAFNAWSYMAFMATMIIIFFLSLKKKNPDDLNDSSGWLVPFLILGLGLSVAFPSQSGSFFGVVDARPYWNSGLLSVMFLTSAITSGTAALMFYFTLIVHDKPWENTSMIYLARVLIGGIVAYLASEFAEYSIAYWSPNSHVLEAARLVIEGPFWWVFWIVHLGGIAASLYFLFVRRDMPGFGIAAFIIATTFVSARLNILIPGQSIAELKGLKEAFYQSRLSFVYTATTLEYLVACFIAAFAVGLAYLGVVYVEKFEKNKLTQL